MALVFRTMLVAMSVGSMGQLAARTEPVQEDERVINLEDLTKAMEAFTITVGSDAVEQLELVRKPVLRYTDPVSSGSNVPIPIGAVFVWKRNGRPEVVSAIHKSRNERLWVEFLALSPNSLKATRKGQVTWTPRTAGIEFNPVKNAAPPAETAPLRLVQMRAIVRDFSAVVSDASSGRQELRLLRQPIVRYSEPNRGIEDEAIFAFARSTNPEMLILLESHVSAGGKKYWVVSPARFARFTGRAGEMRYPDQRVWSHDRFRRRDPTDPFFQMYVLPESLDNGE